jgi:hypothetical protein
MGGFWDACKFHHVWNVDDDPACLCIWIGGLKRLNLTMGTSAKDITSPNCKFENRFQGYAKHKMMVLLLFPFQKDDFFLVNLAENTQRY